MVKYLSSLILIFFLGCKKTINNNISIEIIDDTSKIDLKRGLYTLKYIDKKNEVIKFELSGEEKKQIINSYYIYGIDKIEKEYTAADKCMELPKTYITIIVKGNSSTNIKIDYYCDKYRTNTDNNIKLFLNDLYTILLSKEEIRNAPKANYLHL